MMEYSWKFCVCGQEEELELILEGICIQEFSQPPLSGTSFLKKSDLPHHYLFSDVDWKLIFSIAFNSCKVIEVFSLKALITIM